jgi:uncharacterized protein with HEPN domain
MRPEKLYLTDIIEAADAIGRFCEEISFEEMTSDEMRQAAVLQKLIVIGEAVTRLPSKFHQEHKEIPWADIAGFRNIAVHEYFAIQWDIVWETVTQDVPVLRKQIAELLPLYS